MTKTDFNISDIDFGKSPDGLVPAIVQDYATLKVLMLGYMSRESLERRLKAGKPHFSAGAGNVCGQKARRAATF